MTIPCHSGLKNCRKASFLHLFTLTHTNRSLLEEGCHLAPGPGAFLLILHSLLFKIADKDSARVIVQSDIRKGTTLPGIIPSGFLQ